MKNQNSGAEDLLCYYGLLRIRQVMQMIGFRSRTQVYALVKKGELPQPIKIGKRASAWRAADVILFIETRAVDPFAHSQNVGLQRP